ncbi:MAG: MFS transporter [Pirellulaceae bacterium]|nr:MFS transporter [Pirellulaceae bacterium]
MTGQDPISPSPPTLFADRSFWGMTCTQFLGAFNDNLYKQLMLLLAISIPMAALAGDAVTEVAAGIVEADEGSDVQGWATLVFSLPFVLFSGYAGYLSDRFSKTPIIVLCKVAEIGVMLLGLLAFYYYDVLGMAGTWVVLFLMGTQSAFFGPGKYGILPELFTHRELPRANGIILMTTFLAIIFGTVLAGGLKELLTSDGSNQNLWLALLVCVGIAILGTLTSLMVRKVPPAQPGIKLTADCMAVSNDVSSMLKADRVLLSALLVSSVFWLVSGLAVPTVNRLGLGLLQVGDTATSMLTASIGLGIMGGALFASFLCRKGYGDLSVSLGLWGILGSLVMLGLWSGGGQHLIGFYGSIVALISMGVFAAIFAIPIQVFLQERPPSNLKGRMIATMNQANFVGILISGPLYQVFEWISRLAGWPICSVFLMMGLLVLPLAVFYRLKTNTT